jgi:hypothetical protein
MSDLHLEHSYERSRVRVCLVRRPPLSCVHSANKPLTQFRIFSDAFPSMG